MSESAISWVGNKLLEVYGSKAVFYREVLEKLDEEGLQYVILNLLVPDKNPGDLDVLFLAQCKKDYTSIFRSIGFEYYTKYESHQFLWNKYVPDVGFIQIHCYEKFAFEGLAFLPDTLDVLNEVSKYEFNYYVFLIESFYKGVLRKDVFEEYGKFVNKERFIEYACKLSPQGGNISASMIEAYNTGLIPTRSKKLSSKLEKVWGRIIRIPDKKKDIPVLFIGVDGSGKSTIIEEVYKVFAKGGYYPQKLYLGLRESSLSTSKLESSDSNTKLNEKYELNKRIKSLFRPLKGILYLIEYNLRYLKAVTLKLYGAKTVFLIDRCYIDVLRFYPYPIIRTLFLKFSIIPRKVVFLTGDKDVLYERKREMSMEEFNEIYNFYRDIITDMKIQKGDDLITVNTSENSIKDSTFLVCNIIATANE